VYLKHFAGRPQAQGHAINLAQVYSESIAKLPLPTLSLTLVLMLSLSEHLTLYLQIYYVK